DAGRGPRPVRPRRPPDAPAPHAVPHVGPRRRARRARPARARRPRAGRGVGPAADPVAAHGACGAPDGHVLRHHETHAATGTTHGTATGRPTHRPTHRATTAGGRMTQEAPLPSERRAQLIARVRETGSARVSDLSRWLGVTPVTVRRDLAVLVADGALEKVHGGARVPAAATSVGATTGVGAAGVAATTTSGATAPA